MNAPREPVEALQDQERVENLQNHRLAGAAGTETTNHTPVIAQLNDRWRVILDDSEIPQYRQWTLQRSKIVKGETYWTGESFCQSRTCLLTAIREKIVQAAEFYGGKSMDVDPVALVIIQALPDRVYTTGVSARPVQVS